MGMYGLYEDEMNKLKDENHMLLDALKFYAEGGYCVETFIKEKNWTTSNDVYSVIIDNGEIARAAINKAIG